MALTATLSVQQPVTNPVTRSGLNALVSTAAVAVAGAAGTAQIEDAAVTAAKLAADAVETAKIKDAAVETAKISDGAVTKAKIANGAAGVIFAGDVQASALTAPLELTPTGVWTDVVAVTVTTRAEGSKVLILGSVCLSGERCAARITRDGTPLVIGDADGVRERVAATWFRDDASGVKGGTLPLLALDAAPGAAGEHVYKLQVFTASTFACTVGKQLTLDVDATYSFRGASTLVAVELAAVG
jgi:hypothetical protein